MYSIQLYLAFGKCRNFLKCVNKVICITSSTISFQRNNFLFGGLN